MDSGCFFILFPSSMACSTQLSPHLARRIRPLEAESPSTKLEASANASADANGFEGREGRSPLTLRSCRTSESSF